MKLWIILVSYHVLSSTSVQWHHYTYVQSNMPQVVPWTQYPLLDDNQKIVVPWMQYPEAYDGPHKKKSRHKHREKYISSKEHKSCACSCKKCLKDIKHCCKSYCSRCFSKSMEYPNLMIPQYLPIVYPTVNATADCSQTSTTMPETPSGTLTKPTPTINTDTSSPDTTTTTDTSSSQTSATTSTETTTTKTTTSTTQSTTTTTQTTSTSSSTTPTTTSTTTTETETTTTTPLPTTPNKTSTQPPKQNITSTIYYRMFRKTMKVPEGAITRISYKKPRQYYGNYAKLAENQVDRNNWNVKEYRKHDGIRLKTTKDRFTMSTRGYFIDLVGSSDDDSGEFENETHYKKPLRDAYRSWEYIAIRGSTENEDISLEDNSTFMRKPERQHERERRAHKRNLPKIQPKRQAKNQPKYQPKIQQKNHLTYQPVNQPNYQLKIQPNYQPYYEPKNQPKYQQKNQLQYQPKHQQKIQQKYQQHYRMPTKFTHGNTNDYRKGRNTYPKLAYRLPISPTTYRPKENNIHDRIPNYRRFMDTLAIPVKFKTKPPKIKVFGKKKRSYSDIYYRK